MAEPYVRIEHLILKTIWMADEKLVCSSARLGKQKVVTGFEPMIHFPLATLLLLPTKQNVPSYLMTSINVRCQIYVKTRTVLSGYF